MPNKLRVWYPNAMYHITCRGNRKYNIFREREDYIIYLKILKEALKYFEDEYEIIAYCLMTNHIHLEVKTKNRHIKDFMMRINRFYAKFFNNKYNYVGHLFQARYGAELIDNFIYELEVSRYIHLNPVKANMVKKIEDYKWSSYNVYIGVTNSEIVNCNEVLKYFENNIDLYKSYVNENELFYNNIDELNS